MVNRERILLDYDWNYSDILTLVIVFVEYLSAIGLII